jgi:pentatricopeptide repeat protein
MRTAAAAAARAPAPLTGPTTRRIIIARRCTAPPRDATATTTAVTTMRGRSRTTARASRKRDASRSKSYEEEEEEDDAWADGTWDDDDDASNEDDDGDDAYGERERGTGTGGARRGWRGNGRAAGGRGSYEIVEGPRGEVTTRPSMDESDGLSGGSMAVGVGAGAIAAVNDGRGGAERGDGRRSWRRSGGKSGGRGSGGRGLSSSYGALERALRDEDGEDSSSAAWNLNDEMWADDAAVMLRAADTGDAPAALEALRRMKKVGERGGVAVPLAFYNMTLRACKRSRPPASGDATRLLREMREQGPGPDARTYHEVIAAYARALEWRLAEQTFEEMKRDFKGRGPTWYPSVRVYTSLISAYGKGGQFEKARDLFNTLVQNPQVQLDTGVYNVRRNVTTYNGMLQSLGRQRRIRDMETMCQSMQHAGVMPNETTYSTLITAHGNNGNINRALELLHQVIIAPRLHATSVIFNSALGACVKAGSLEGTQQVLRVMTSEGVVSTLVTYNTLLMEASAERDWPRAKALYKELLVAGFEPDTITLDCLCGIEKLQARREQALQEEIARAEREGTELPECERVCDVNDSPVGELPVLMRQLADDKDIAKISGAKGHVCDALLRVLHVNNENSEVEETFHQMVRQGIPRTVHTYNSLLISYEARKEWQKAGDAMAQMTSEGITPNALTFDALIDVCEEMGQWDRATSWLEQAQAAGHFRCEDDLGVLDLHRIRSAGTAQCVLRWWLRRMRQRALAPLDVRAAGKGTRALVSGLTAGKNEIPIDIRDLPEQIQVVTGWGKHSTVYGHSPVKERTVATLGRLNSPFAVPQSNIGCLIADRGAVRTWLVRDELLSLVRFLGGNKDALRRNFNPESGPVSARATK